MRQDCIAAFPELQLFMATENEATSSGRSAAEEYQRTLGALFAVYWLMRLHGDGLQSFVYGVGPASCPRFRTLFSIVQVFFHSF